MPLDFARTRTFLQQFDFHRLFIEELGWSHADSRKPVAFSVRGSDFTRREIAQLAGVSVYEIESAQHAIPDAKTRAAVQKEIAQHRHENLLIFVDRERTQSLWYWVKRQDGKLYPRDHLYCKGQPGDLFLSKLGQIVFDLSEFDAEGNVRIIEVAGRLRSALDIERVTKKFFREFQDQHVAFLELIRGIRDERQRRWYASVLLNRLMFIYFLQKKGFVDGGKLSYLGDKLAESKQRGKNRYFSEFLKTLFFEGFAKPEGKRSTDAKKLLGQIKYLNGGLFPPHHVEQHNPKIAVPDEAFDNLFALFDRYSWNLDDTPGGQDDEINPDVLGYILTLCRELHMTDDSDLFLESPIKGRLPLCEGKMIHQFNHQWSSAKYWINETEARARLMAWRLKTVVKSLEQVGVNESEARLRKQLELDYDHYRLAFRDVARNTDERTMISTILPRKILCPHTMSLEIVLHVDTTSSPPNLNHKWMADAERCFLVAIFNSFCLDFLIRQRVTAHLSFFFVYNLPVPRLRATDVAFAPIVDRAARLICTTAEFDGLAKEVGLKSHCQGVTDGVERAKLRAELDGLIAHLYGLTESEFAHILTTFPLVPDPVKIAAQNAYRDVERGLIR